MSEDAREPRVLMIGPEELRHLVAALEGAAVLRAELERLKEQEAIRKETEGSMLREALYDTITGLPARGVFINRLRQTMALARGRQDFGYALLFMDLDRFKVVNDSMGHMAGDQLLKEVAGRLEVALRETDTACRYGAGRALARFGGDEFTVLLEGLGGPEDAARVADRILASLAQPFQVGGQETLTSASIGIVMGSRDYERPDQVLRDADVAMYAAKTAGRRRFVVFDESLHHAAVDLLELEADLRRAVAGREFVLHYQPVLSLATGQICSFEALIRWQKPGEGLVAPAVFLPVAEEAGLMMSLGEWALEEACSTARKWQDMWPERNLGVAVNISSRQFAEPDFVGTVRQALLDSGLRPSHLKLEVTESLLMQNSATVESTFSRLRALGVELQMDDFGTGYSSLSYLHRFPFEGLKIDRSFIQEMSRGRRTMEVVRTIVKLAHDLGLEVTAEGVETQAQYEELARLGCDKAQGFLWARPLSEGDAEAMLMDAGTLIPGAPAVS